MERKEINIANTKESVFDNQMQSLQYQYVQFKKERYSNFVIEKLKSVEVMWFVDNIKNYKKFIMEKLDEESWKEFLRLTLLILENLLNRDQINRSVADEKSLKHASEPLVDMVDRISKFRLAILRIRILSYYKEEIATKLNKLPSVESLEKQLNAINDPVVLEKMGDHFFELIKHVDLIGQHREYAPLYEVGLERFHKLYSALLLQQNIDIQKECNVFKLKADIVALFYQNQESLKELQYLCDYCMVLESNNPGLIADQLKSIFVIINYLINSPEADVSVVADHMNRIQRSTDKRLVYQLDMKILQKVIQELKGRNKSDNNFITLLERSAEQPESKDQEKNEKITATRKLIFELNRLDEATKEQEETSLARIAYQSLTQAVKIQLEKNVSADQREILANLIADINYKLDNANNDAEFDIERIKPLFDGRADWSWGKCALAAVLCLAGAALFVAGLMAAPATAGVSASVVTTYAMKLIIAGCSLFSGGVILGIYSRPYGFTAELSRNVNCFYTSLDKKNPERVFEVKESPKPICS